ncbi:trypsin-like peptidase domain-containing protein [Tautonia sociabilis]|uniref:PDZ domain-containing protein n=1 Tax=Tautonia sociabilis TaxID=2080755 RepID=A0A432MLM0_9BACT|nr:trypsin-like peptidase domain-containing protein [Tautonia sociabilis]RUL88180.1 PDZ domain-containing protein [Tautonia sociabilis]
MTHLLPPVMLAILAAAGPADDGLEPLDVVSALERAVTDAIEATRPSVVTIDRIRSENGTTLAVRGRDRTQAVGDPRTQGVVIDAFGLRAVGPESIDYPSFDFGSGVVVGEDGQILTAYHVVEGAARLFIRASGLDPIEAEILAADPRSDLAVIAPVVPVAKIPGAPGLRPIPIGDASGLRPGTFLVALGNTHNASRDGRASASFGILANTARRLIPPPNEFGQLEATQLQHFSTLFQLDSKLNLGMSGGAVVNLKGELIAITTASANVVGYDPRAGYAMPMDELGRHALDALIEGREVEYGFLGISLDRNGGASNVVLEVQPGTPAGEGGLLQGDQIIRVNDQPVSDFDGLVRAVNPLPVGEPAVLTIRRGNEVLTKEVVLSKFPVVGEVIATNLPEPWRGLRVDYASVASPREDLLLAMARGGVAVIEVSPETPAEAAGLRAGSIISSVEGRPIRTPRAFREAVAELDGKPVRLGTDRGLITIPPEGGQADD